MYYKIENIVGDGRDKSERAFVRLVVEVAFWADDKSHDAGDPPQWREDFHMDLRGSFSRIVRDGRGWLSRTNGTFVDPTTLRPGDVAPKDWSRETVAVDVSAEIRANIERYLARRPAKAGDHRDPRVEAVRQDSQGLLARSDVLALKGSGKTTETRATK